MAPTGNVGIKFYHDIIYGSGMQQSPCITLVIQCGENIRLEVKSTAAKSVDEYKTNAGSAVEELTTCMSKMCEDSLESFLNVARNIIGILVQNGLEYTEFVLTHRQLDEKYYIQCSSTGEVICSRFVLPNGKRLHTCGGNMEVTLSSSLEGYSTGLPLQAVGELAKQVEREHKIRAKVARPKNEQETN